jgi:hypothetical protein
MRVRQGISSPAFGVVMEGGHKDAYSSLKKLEKSFRDFDSTQRKYGKATKRLGGEDNATELDDKSARHIQELYRDFCTHISKSES